MNDLKEKILQGTLKSLRTIDKLKEDQILLKLEKCECVHEYKGKYKR